MSSLIDIDTATRAVASARAVVCAGGSETAYVRVGRGDPIVLVVDDVDAVSTQGLLETLSARYVVFAAAPRLRGEDLTRWLAGFIEALGVNEGNVMVLVATTEGVARD